MQNQNFAKGDKVEHVSSWASGYGIITDIGPCKVKLSPYESIQLRDGEAWIKRFTGDGQRATDGRIRLSAYEKVIT